MKGLYIVLAIALVDFVLVAGFALEMYSCVAPI